VLGTRYAQYTLQVLQILILLNKAHTFALLSRTAGFILITFCPGYPCTKFPKIMSVHLWPSFNGQPLYFLLKFINMGRFHHKYRQLRFAAILTCTDVTFTCFHTWTLLSISLHSNQVYFLTRLN
jgi:hypothetical protein